MVTTETNNPPDAIQRFRDWIEGRSAFLDQDDAKALLREASEARETFQAMQQRVENLQRRLSEARALCRAGQQSILDLERVNNNLAAEQEQHSDRDEVASIIAVHQSEELDHTLFLLGQSEIAVQFYRRLALDGVRINGATDAAFLTALELDL